MVARSQNNGEVTRVNLIVPSELWDRVKRLAPPGKRSQLLVNALEEEVERREQLALLDQIRAFGDELEARYGIGPDSANEIEAMREERDARNFGLR